VNHSTKQKFPVSALRCVKCRVRSEQWKLPGHGCLGHVLHAIATCDYYPGLAQTAECVHRDSRLPLSVLCFHPHPSSPDA
jgi:hypothetical protein